VIRRKAKDSDVRACSPLRWDDAAKLRRVRSTDNGDDAASIMQQRCLRHARAIAFRTTATMLGSAMVVMAAGAYVYVNDRNAGLRGEVAAADGALAALMSKHGHADAVKIRELEVFRGRFDALEAKLDAVHDRLVFRGL